MKTLGILGGMGPYATSHFFKTILDRTKAVKDSDHLHIIIDNNINIPSRTRALLCYNEESPVVGIRSACFKLMDMGCDYIAVPCNSAHYFYDDVVKNTDIPWVNMIEVVSKELEDFNRVLIVGGFATIVGKIYDKFLNNTVYLKNYEVVFNLIEKIKLQKDCSNLLEKFYSQVEDEFCILLGCTELPMVIDYRSDLRMIDGNLIYIDKLIEMCGAKINEWNCRKILEDKN
jgi:aspartate racemase